MPVVRLEGLDDAALAAIEHEMQGDGVWIDPAFARAHEISAADEQALEEAVASTEHADLRVLLVEVDPRDERFSSFSQLSAWIHDSAGGDATYVGWGGYEPLLSVQSFGDQPDTSSVANVANHEHPGDVVDQVLRIGELLDDGNAEQLWQEVPHDERYSWTADEGGLDPWWWIAIVAVAALGLGVAWRARRGTRAAPRPARAGFALPATVLHAVRSAEDRRLRQEAESAVLALGEALGSGEVAARSGPGLDSWRQALDHYAAARRVLDLEPSPADVVGALVLAHRGESARTSAVRQKAWSPEPGCWFNPLHDGSVREVSWRDDEREVDVPACSDCATAVESGREPDDVLDFIQDDRTVHYFRLDLGAWTTTGYGTLDPDLLGALHRRPS